MKSTVVFYHSSCPDGFGAAWAAWRKLGNGAQYVPISASQTPDQLEGMRLEGRKIYFLDVCAPAATLKKLAAGNRSVTVIDHHRTNGDRGAYVTDFIFDVGHSGAVLAWKYFHPKVKVPWLLKYIEDYDLWKFSLPHAKEMIPAIHMRPQSFPAWNGMQKELERPSERARYYSEGKLLFGYQEGVIRELADKADLVEFGGKKVYAINSSAKDLIDRIAHALYSKRPPFSVVWHESEGKLKVSLRSDGGYDVSKLATKFPGGGGHKVSAGFTVPIKAKFPWKKAKR